MKFEMHELSAGDGIPLNGDNPNDKFDKDNLADVGVSKELAEALDGKTIGEFKDIALGELNSKRNINLELVTFAKELFASYHDTGYEDNIVGAAITKLESDLQDAWPTKEVRGLAYSYEGNSGMVAGEEGSPPLPEALQMEEATRGGTGYFGTTTPTDRALAGNNM